MKQFPWAKYYFKLLQPIHEEYIDLNNLKTVSHRPIRCIGSDVYVEVSAIEFYASSGAHLDLFEDGPFLSLVKPCFVYHPSFFDSDRE